MFSDLAQLVVKQWISGGLHPNKVPSIEAIIEEFLSVGITPTNEVLEVLSCLNGFDDGEMDGDCFNFWSIEKIIKEKRPNLDIVEFADFLIDSHCYGFKEESDKSTGLYIVYSDNDKIKIADSFLQFFQLYLSDTAKLFA